jgi:hypothetical protein
MALKRKKPKTTSTKMSDKHLPKEPRKDLHTMVLEAEGALALKSKKRGR